jgi:hypothetical protein
MAWPSARVHSHLLAAMPPGVFPGVDDTEVLRFLERQGLERQDLERQDLERQGLAREQA